MKFQEFMEKSHLMALYREYQLFFTPLNREIKNLGTNLNDSLILLALFFESNKGSTPGQLEKTLAIPKDQVSQSLKRLETKLFIRRDFDRQDKRKRILKITAEGKKQASVLIKCFDQKENLYENNISSKRNLNDL